MGVASHPMNITPLPGTSVVELDSQFDALATAAIILPQGKQSVPIRSGTVKAANLTGTDKALLGIDDIAGLKVILDARHGTIIDGKLTAVFPNLVQINKGVKGERPKFKSPFLAIYDGAKIQAVTSDESPRCMFCGPAKSSESQQAMILVRNSKGIDYCPRCKRTPDGGRVE